MKSRLHQYLEVLDNIVTVDGVIGRMSEEGVIIINTMDLDDQLQGSQYDNEEAATEAQRMIEEAKVRNEEFQKHGGFAGIPSEQYAKFSVMLRAWLKANNAHYYAREKRKFFISQAIDEALELGKKIVVVDNLS